MVLICTTEHFQILFRFEKKVDMKAGSILGRLLLSSLSKKVSAFYFFIYTYINIYKFIYTIYIYSLYKEYLRQYLIKIFVIGLFLNKYIY